MSVAPVAPELWLEWDGRRLAWNGDAAKSHCSEVHFCIDGVIFERIAVNSAMGRCERDFAFSPSGRDEIEFSLHAADSSMIGEPWRVLYGHAARVGANAWEGAPRAMQPMPTLPLPKWTGASTTAIVVPIFNLPDLVRHCIAAVLRWTRGQVRLILIDDASTDPGVATLLANYEHCGGIVVRRNPHNLGYTRSTNLGIELAGDADVVLLNSDTQVGPRWLDVLRQVAYSDAAIGTVTAVSDNAGAFSVPELEQYCPIPAQWTLPMVQRALLQNAGGCLPELPTGNGFCMFVKRAMLDRVGVLDADAFPSGYGEENDLCQRGEHAGFRHVIAGNVFVQHERSASFGEARRAALGAQGMQVLRSRYPDYEAKVGATLFSFARRVLDYRVRRIYADRDGVYAVLPPRPRIAFAVDESGPSVQALAAALQSHYECFVLRVDGKDIESHLGQWLASLAIELVQVLSAQAGDVGLMRAAAHVGVPVLDSSADAQLQAMCNSVDSSDPEASVQLAACCTALYEACWRDSASFAEAGAEP